MAKQNPFNKAMARLQIPPHMGQSISVRGFEVEADEDGCVEVPPELVAELKGHGLTDPPAPVEASKKK